MSNDTHESGQKHDKSLSPLSKLSITALYVAITVNTLSTVSLIYLFLEYQMLWEASMTLLHVW